MLYLSRGGLNELLALASVSGVSLLLAHWLLGGDKAWASYLQTHFRDNGQGAEGSGSRHGVTEAEVSQPRDLSHIPWVFWLLGEPGPGSTPGLAGCQTRTSVDTG